MHCTTEDCIGCFGQSYYVANGNGCSNITGQYIGDCHDCYDENPIPTDNRTRNQGTHTHPSNPHYHQLMTNSDGTVGPGGYMASTTQNFTGGTNQGQGNPDSPYQSGYYQANTANIGNTGEAGAHRHPSGIPAIPNSGNGNTNNVQTVTGRNPGNIPTHSSRNTINKGMKMHHQQNICTGGNVVFCYDYFCMQSVQIPCSDLNGDGWACDSMCAQASDLGGNGNSLHIFEGAVCSGIGANGGNYVMMDLGECQLEESYTPGSTRGTGNTGGGGNQTNLRTRGGQFRNRRTGKQVLANQPYHTHDGQAMAGAKHVNTPHDKYDRFGGRTRNPRPLNPRPLRPRKVPKPNAHVDTGECVDCSRWFSSAECTAGGTTGVSEYGCMWLGENHENLGAPTECFCTFPGLGCCVQETLPTPPHECFDCSIFANASVCEESNYVHGCNWYYGTSSCECQNKDMGCCPY